MKRINHGWSFAQITRQCLHHSEKTLRIESNSVLFKGKKKNTQSCVVLSNLSGRQIGLNKALKTKITGSLKLHHCCCLSGCRTIHLLVHLFATWRKDNRKRSFGQSAKFLQRSWPHRLLRCHIRPLGRMSVASPEVSSCLKAAFLTKSTFGRRCYSVSPYFKPNYDLSRSRSVPTSNQTKHRIVSS